VRVAIVAEGVASLTLSGVIPSVNYAKPN